MPTNLVNTKSILAKLLATENLSVVHEKINTAFFDVKNRTLHLPIWEVMDGDLYDLLVGHEDGHALYTPAEGWHNAISEKGKAYKSILNIVEDARIEKLIKRKYPGLARSFSKAYSHLLFERNFFGVRNLKDYSKLNLADRINLYFKVGAHLIIPFTDEERAFVDEISKVETWDNVVDIADRIHSYMKAHEQEKINSISDLAEQLRSQVEDSEEPDEESEESDENSEFEKEQVRKDAHDLEKMLSEQMENIDENFSEDSQESEDDSESESEDSQESEESEESSDGDSESESEKSGNSDSDSVNESSEEINNGEDEETENSFESQDSEEGDDSGSITDYIFREREKELVENVGDVVNTSFPEPILDRIVVSNELVLHIHESSITDKKVVLQQMKNCVSSISKKNNRFIAHLVKEFEMRKNASQYARTTVARTGELDMNKLHAYRYSSDLFKKISVVPKGKSHGLIIFVDMSSSMSRIMKSTFEQVFILASFCKRVNIPFDVYGFTDNPSFFYGKGNAYEEKFHELRKLSSESFTNTDGWHMPTKKCFLMHFIGSSLGKITYQKSLEMLAYAATCYNYGSGYNWSTSCFVLESTPLNQTILASRKIIDNFKSKHKVDITNVMYITDGDGTDNFLLSKKGEYTYVKGRLVIPKIICVDKKTKKSVTLSQDRQQQQSKLTEFVRDLTGCKHIGYYICRDRDLNRISNNNLALREIKRKFKDDGFVSVPSIGFDSYFYINPQTMNVNMSDDIGDRITDGMTSRKMARVFSDINNKKISTRRIVADFAKEISSSL